jgi:hypothetical protein
MLFDIQLPTNAYSTTTKFRVYLHTFTGDGGNNNKAPYTYQATSYSPYFLSTDPSTDVTWTDGAGTAVTLSGLNYYNGNLVFTSPGSVSTGWQWIKLDN